MLLIVNQLQIHFYNFYLMVLQYNLRKKFLNFAKNKHWYDSDNRQSNNQQPNCFGDFCNYDGCDHCGKAAYKTMAAYEREQRGKTETWQDKRGASKYGETRHRQERTVATVASYHHGESHSGACWRYQKRMEFFGL